MGLYPGDRIVDPGSVIRKPYEMCVTTWKVRDLEVNSHLDDPVCAQDFGAGTWVVDTHTETGYTTLSPVSVQSLVGERKPEENAPDDDATPPPAEKNTWSGRVVMPSLAICVALATVIFIRRLRSGKK